ncbi:hypothetical protein PIS_048 [Saccharomonospora phage PIS 136]|nr:hypothetical protein PIS_048 [Saccharomonospora phage PIS 136]
MLPKPCLRQRHELRTQTLRPHPHLGGRLNRNRRRHRTPLLRVCPNTTKALPQTRGIRVRAFSRELSARLIDTRAVRQPSRTLAGSGIEWNGRHR